MSSTWAAVARSARQPTMAAGAAAAPLSGAVEHMRKVPNELMRRFPDGREYPERLCYSPGDESTRDWVPREVAQGGPDPSKYYPVEAVLDEAMCDGRMVYLVKWKGYELNEHGWIASALLDGCLALSVWEAQQAGMSLAAFEQAQCGEMPRERARKRTRVAISC